MLRTKIWLHCLGQIGLLIGAKNHHTWPSWFTGCRLQVDRWKVLDVLLIGYSSVIDIISWNRTKLVASINVIWFELDDASQIKRLHCTTLFGRRLQEEMSRELESVQKKWREASADSEHLGAELAASRASHAAAATALEQERGEHSCTRLTVDEYSKKLQARQTVKPFQNQITWFSVYTLILQTCIFWILKRKVFRGDLTSIAALQHER